MATVAITSDEDAGRAVGLVEEAAVDGQRGPAQDAAHGRGDAGHLWTGDRNISQE